MAQWLRPFAFPEECRKIKVFALIQLIKTAAITLY